MNINMVAVYSWIGIFIFFQIGGGLLWSRFIRPRAILSGKPITGFGSTQRRYMKALLGDKGKNGSKRWSERVNMLWVFHMPLILIGLTAALLWLFAVVSWKVGIFVPLVAMFISMVRVQFNMKKQNAMVFRLFSLASSAFKYRVSDKRAALNPWKYIHLASWNSMGIPTKVSILVPAEVDTTKDGFQVAFQNHFKAALVKPDQGSYLFDWVPDEERLTAEWVKPLPKKATWDEYEEKIDQLTLGQIPLGLNEHEEVEVWDLNVNPHSLLAGTTGGGKSSLQRVMLRYMIEKHPHQYKIYGVDLKRTELTQYEAFPTVAGVSITLEDTYEMLNSIKDEMFHRLDILHQHGVSDFKGIDPDAEEYKYIVIILDECAQLLNMEGGVGATPEAKEERQLKGACGSIVGQIAQLGRAPRVHLSIASQRMEVKSLGPSGGNLKLNSTERISAGRADKIASQMVFDSSIGTTIPVIPGRGMAGSLNDYHDIQIFWIDPEKDWPKGAGIERGETTSGIFSGNLEDLDEEELPDAPPIFHFGNVNETV